MKRSIFVAALLACSGVLSVESPRVIETTSTQVKRRKMNKTANKIKVFYGYASERKGKGEKARNRSNRRGKGWI